MNINFIKRSTLCLVNAGITTQYFNLERGARQGDMISAYLFILTLEILFLLIKKHPEIKGIEITEHCFLSTAYADNITFFLKDLQSTAPLVEIFNTFYYFFRIETKIRKSGNRSPERGSIGKNAWVCVMEIIKFQVLASHTTTQ